MADERVVRDLRKKFTPGPEGGKPAPAGGPVPAVAEAFFTRARKQQARRKVSVHGARGTAVPSGLGIGTAPREPLWPPGTPVDAPASMRTTPGLGDDFLHEPLASGWPHRTRRPDASACRSYARWGLRLARVCRC